VNDTFPLELLLLLLLLLLPSTHSHPHSRALTSHSQFSVFPDWPGGIYGTPSMAGSRPGALVAATYCAMMMQGKEGYRKAAKRIMEITKKVAEGIKAIKGLRLMCEPQSR
jgi:sphinganine-1-phosphate aldolase